jgi:hypothetical protein
MGRSSLLLATVMGVFIYGIAVFFSWPAFFVDVQASVLKTEAGEFTSRGGGDYVAIEYSYDFDGVRYTGAGIHSLRKYYVGARRSAGARAYVSDWIGTHPSNSKILVQVFRLYPSLSRYDASHEDWLSTFLWYATPLWILGCLALASGTHLVRLLLKGKQK